MDDLGVPLFLETPIYSLYSWLRVNWLFPSISCVFAVVCCCVKVWGGSPSLMKYQGNKGFVSASHGKNGS